MSRVSTPGRIGLLPTRPPSGCETGTKKIMESIAISLFLLLCLSGSASLGYLLRTKLPPEHFADDSREVLKLAMGLVATMAALVLGLLTASAKSGFDLLTSEVQQGAAKIIQLDRALVRYGPEAKALREELKALITLRLQLNWPEEYPASGPAKVSESPSVQEQFLDHLDSLEPINNGQRDLKSAAVQIWHDLLATRWLAYSQAARPLPTVFLIVMGLWLSVLFAGFGLLAARNATTAAGLIVCAVVVSTSVFLILEMNRPLDGVMKVSSSPLRYALSQLGR